MNIPTLNKQVCPQCGQSVNEREIGLFTGMVTALWRVFEWSEQKGINEFTRKDIKHLFTDENMTARFGDWVMFGGLVYKPDGKSTYGLNRERIIDFFNGKIPIPTTILKNPLTRTLEKSNHKFIGQIPNLGSFLDENKEFIVRYAEPQRELF